MKVTRLEIKRQESYETDAGQLKGIVTLTGTAGQQSLVLSAGSISRIFEVIKEDAVAQAAYLYERLTAVGLHVIRVALQPDKELCKPGNILAGPFHPSMGELVQSYLQRQRVASLLHKYKYVPGD